MPEKSRTLGIKVPKRSVSVSYRDAVCYWSAASPEGEGLASGTYHGYSVFYQLFMMLSLSVACLAH